MPLAVFPLIEHNLTDIGLPFWLVQMIMSTYEEATIQLDAKGERTRKI